jgi:antitoxin ParD1/3/4
MNVSLTPEIERLVREKIARGEYESAEAFVSQAVQRMIDEDNEEDALRDQIRGRIEAAEAEIDRGEYGEYDEGSINELAKDVHRRGLKRLASERNKTGTRG